MNSLGGISISVIYISNLEVEKKRDVLPKESGQLIGGGGGVKDGRQKAAEIALLILGDDGEVGGEWMNPSEYPFAGAKYSQSAFALFCQRHFTASAPRPRFYKLPLQL